MRRTKSLLLAATLVCPASLAYAQDRPDPQQANAAPAEVSQSDIVVTAQKRSERLLDVPVSVAVVNTDKLVAENLTQLRDFYARVPGLTYVGGGGYTTLAIRGIASSLVNNPTVGITIDDAPLGSSQANASGSLVSPDLDPSILENIEVLRGPQGTLYGASSMGGLLKYVTRKPDTNDWFGQAEIGGEAVDHGSEAWSTRGSLNVPVVSDHVGLSVSGFFRRDPGYVDAVAANLPDSNTEKAYGGRIAALIKPVDGVSIVLAAVLQDLDGLARPVIPTDANYVPLAGSLLASNTYLTPPIYSVKNRIYTANITANLGFADLTSISAYSNLSYFLNTDITVRFAQILDMVGLGGQRAFVDNAVTTKKFSQELRLSSHEGGALDWLVGGFFTSERSPQYQSLTAVSSTGETTDLSTDAGPEHFREMAAFADLTYHFTKKFEIQVGGRYSENKQTYIVGGGTGILGDGSPAVEQESRDHSFTWLITPRYTITPNLMTYARIATGYRPGGPNSPLIVNNPVYGPDRTTNYEVGLKGETSDKRFGYDVALFWIDWSNIQISQTDAATQQDFFINANNARSRGAELELYYHPWRGMTLDGSGAYTDAVLRSSLPELGGAASSAIGNKGDRLPYSSRWSGSFSADQRFQVRSDLALSVGGTISYVGQRLGSFSPSGVRGVAPAYTTIDLRGSVETGPITASLFIRNATDRRGLTGVELTTTADPNGGFLVSIIQPRTFGGSIAVKF